MPVVSMSMRPFTGMVQALETPGRLSASFIRATSSSRERVSGVMTRSAPFIQSGAQDEYQVSFFRHSDLGFRVITVSSMESGAGSVEVSALPALPNTRFTSGKPFRMRSVTCRSFCASVMEMPGMVVGIYISEPSSRGGMNSDPSFRKTGTVTSTRTRAVPSTTAFRRSAQVAAGS